MPHVDLLELPYFQGISIDSLVALVDSLEPAQFAAGDMIVTQGRPTPLFIATTGQVAVVKQSTPPDGETTLAELDSPTLFGEIELFCQLPAVASVRAMSPVSAFVMNTETFSHLRKTQNEAILQFVFNVARVACHRLAVADEIIARCVRNEDVVKVREAIFTQMTQDEGLSTTTGAFRVITPKD